MGLVLLLGGCPDFNASHYFFACEGPDCACDLSQCRVPAGRCLDGQTLLTSRVTGCAPACTFSQLETACAQGCADGACVGEPCAGVSCEAPPGNACSSGATLRAWVHPGSCEGGTCRYGFVDLACAGGCASGRCVDDPCAGVTCTVAPPPLCDGATARHFSSAGTCDPATGACDYPAIDTSCAAGCAAGACVGDACAGVVCDAPPAPYCQDAQTLVTSATGSCTGGGSCSYPSTRQACGVGLVCQGGACGAGDGGVDPCQGVTCATPPAATCATASTLRTFAGPGTCSGGACSYTSTDTTCPSGCASGACAAADGGTGLPAWAQEAYVKASNTGVGGRFGYAVALSSDGSTLAVGAYYEGSSATGVDGNQADNSAAGAGAVYVFRRSGAVWAQEAYVKASNTEAGDSFGIAVALSSDGSALAVGAANEASGATGVDGSQADNSASGAGAVYVFRRTGSVWAQEAYVKASNTAAGDVFGQPVALSGDGSVLAVGANFESSSSLGVNGNQADNSASAAGAAYVFRRSGSTWAQEAYVKASNTGVGDHFGYALALSSDGTALAVGAASEDGSATGVNGNQADEAAWSAGAAYVFRRTGSTWAQEAYVKASNTGAGDNFGSAVALSADGSALAVGAAYEDSSAAGVNGNQADNSATEAGAAYVFRRTGTTWAQEAYVKASNAGASDYFGYSLVLSADGSTLAVAAAYEDSSATGVNGNQADESAAQAGAVYVFRRAGVTWAQEAYVKASNTEARDLFSVNGLALSGDGSTLAVGAHLEDSSATGVDGNQADNSATAAGAAYVFRH